MSNPKISVIIPIYNVELFLDTCIFSVVNQTYKNLEIILVDDGSTDTSPQICDKWATVDKRIRVIHKKNGGVSEARNYGLDRCTGELIAFVDSDDWVDNEMYATMLSAMENTNADICSCGRIYEGEGRKRRPVAVFTGSSAVGLEMLFSYPNYPVDVWNKLYKRKIWTDIRFPKGKFYEDVFVMPYLIGNAKIVTQITDEFYHYRIRNGSITNSAFSKYKMDEEEGWRNACSYIQQAYPALFRKAFSFYMIKVALISSSIHKEQLRFFEKEHNFLCGIIRENLLFIIFRSEMTYVHRINLLKIITRTNFMFPCVW